MNNSPANPAISIGAQMGGPEACSIGDLKVLLYHAFAKHVSLTHCAAIDEYAIVLRVDGTLSKFGEEGLTRLRFAKSSRYITVDIQIPESVWQPMSEQQTRAYLAQKVSDAIEMCVKRLSKNGEHVAYTLLKAEMGVAIDEFLGTGRNV